jgi:hypothetical protein
MPENLLNLIDGTRLVDTATYLSKASRNGLDPLVVEQLLRRFATISGNFAYLASCLAATAERFDRKSHSSISRKQLAVETCTLAASLLDGVYSISAARNPVVVLESCHTAVSEILAVNGAMPAALEVSSPLDFVMSSWTRGQSELLQELSIVQQGLVYVADAHVRVGAYDRTARASQTQRSRQLSILNNSIEALTQTGKVYRRAMANDRAAASKRCTDAARLIEGLLSLRQKTPSRSSERHGVPA